MAMNQDLPATDSATALHELIGEDSTATFENDPKFLNDPTMAEASSENLQTRSDRQEIQNSESLATRDLDDTEDEDDEEDDEDEDDLDDEDLDDEDDLDEDDEDEDDDLDDDDEDDDDDDEE